MAFLKPVDFEIGRMLSQLLERKLYREFGFESFERYVQERLDLSPRTVRRLVRLAQAERGADVAWNRTTFCAYHHHRGVHAASLTIRGKTPDGIVYTLGVGRSRSGDVRW